MISFFDSHEHMASNAFDADRDAVIERAIAAGALGILCIGESVDAATRAREVAERYPDTIWWTAGIHPHDAAEFDSARDLDALRTFVGQGALAIGECGLDYHYNNSPPRAQRHAFAMQLALARELDRPVVVHTRAAVEDTRAMISDAATGGGEGLAAGERRGQVRGVLHCFTGPIELALEAVALGWYVSFSGIITFRGWTDEALLRVIPEDRLLVESDSPYLAPVPNRGRRNEPAWVERTIARLAQARDTDAGNLAATTSANARRFLKLDALATPA